MILMSLSSEKPRSFNRAHVGVRLPGSLLINHPSSVEIMKLRDEVELLRAGFYFLPALGNRFNWRHAFPHIVLAKLIPTVY